MRVAAVDLGTNSTRFLVADVENGAVKEVARGLRITGLGAGVDARRRLLPLPIARVRNSLSDFRREIERLGAERTLAVGTSAVRDADNGEAFLGEVEWSYGFATRLLSGNEEAALTFRGALLGRSDADGAMVVDLGGGSTELVTPERAVSIDIGSVRMTEQLGEDVEAIAARVRELLPAKLAPQRAIGVAGTITSLAALDLGLDTYDPDRVHGHVLSAAAVDEQLQRLAALSLEERRRLPSRRRGKETPRRAPTPVADPRSEKPVARAADEEAAPGLQAATGHAGLARAAAVPPPHAPVLAVVQHVTRRVVVARAGRHVAPARGRDDDEPVVVERNARELLSRGVLEVAAADVAGRAVEGVAVPGRRLTRREERPGENERCAGEYAPHPGVYNPSSTSGGGSSSASLRWSTLRLSTPTRRPPSVTGTRSASRSSRKWKASSSGRSDSIV